MTKYLRNIAFVFLGVLTVLMIVATIVEKIYNTPTALQWFYHSPVVIALWAMTTVIAMSYIIINRYRMSVATFSLHCSFAVILIGATITHFYGEQGTIKLVDGDKPIDTFTLNNGKTATFPFSVRMIKTEISYYTATSTPMDYATDIAITQGDKTTATHVSMNNIGNFAGYRFYQTALGDNYSIMSVSHDPWGIGITYAGYAMLFISAVAFFFSRKSRFRSIAIVAVCLFSINGNAQQVLQRPLANNFGKMMVYWNGRVAPVQTLAREFCTKVYGSDSYHGFTAEQVLTGWIFYYDDWKNEPFIKIKDAEMRQCLGISGKYASLHDFYAHGKYKPESLLTGTTINKEALLADEKVNLIAQICTGKALRIYPIVTTDGSLTWQSWADHTASNVPTDDALFIKTSMDDVARNIMLGKYNAANNIITEICDFQRREAVNDILPSKFTIAAERIYNKVSHTLIAAILAIVIGLAAFLNICKPKYIYAATIALLCYLTFVIALRWIISGHLPLTNGFETMQMTAWIASVVILLTRRISVLRPMGLIVSGLALMVSVMGESNPTVSHLMPVLASPLLSIHVMLIMTSYALFAIMMLNSIASFIQPSRSYHLANVSTKLIYPAVMALAAGIFVGAIWANQSWGRYWGWDPKETWALITLLIYALPLHTISFKKFSQPRTIHLYYLLAFLSVLMTYFGVNYLLSGMHSYAVG